MIVSSSAVFPGTCKLYSVSSTSLHCTHSLECTVTSGDDACLACLSLSRAGCVPPTANLEEHFLIVFFFSSFFTARRTRAAAVKATRAPRVATRPSVVYTSTTPKTQVFSVPFWDPRQSRARGFCGRLSRRSAQQLFPSRACGSAMCQLRQAW